MEARGLARQVVPPGKNRKAHLAGALDLRTRHLHVVEGGRKTSRLFLDLLEALLRRHPGARRIRVVLDNYVIHRSRQVQAQMRDRVGRTPIHFLPPDCPDENPIERVWLNLHANVTRNHTRRNLGWLLHDVRRWIRRRNAAKLTVARRAA